MTTKTATIKAWLPSHADIKAAHAADADASALLNACGFASSDMTEHGWVYIGEATITVNLLPSQTLTQQHIEALRKEQAELSARAALIGQQINNLLAIGYSPEAA
jgi:hypothetical protein